MKKINICCYPTTAFFIDDQANFLNDLKLGLDEDTVACFYQNPQHAL